MRLAIAGFSLESVTFLPGVTGVPDFEHGARRGQSVIQGLTGTNTAIGGFLDVCAAERVETVGILDAGAGAAAAASEAAFDKYVAEIVAGLVALWGRIDGLLIHLHGALATPSRRQADADVLGAIGAAMGAEFPVGVAMDLHGNLGQAVLDHATVIAGYHKSPHTDMATTGMRAARLLIRALRGETKPVMAIAKPGLMLPSIFSATMLEPLAGIMRQARAWETRETRILDISVFCGFAYADVPDCGMAVVVVADGEPALAARAADDLANQARLLRFQLYKEELVMSVAAGVEQALALAKSAAKPILLLEHADRLNDSTYVLRALIERGAKRVYAPFMFDPEVAAAAIRAGEGATITVDFAGKTSPQAGGPVRLTARVLYAGRKVFNITGPLKTGSQIDLGETALLDAGGILISVVSVQWSAIDRDCFDQFGLRPEDFAFILLRSKTHFREVYTPLAEAIIIIDTPDWGPADLKTLPYRHIPPGVFPVTQA
ncbi:MAG: M81 family peptidase [Alphaproteobacteria bacterium]|nr:M81 family peptidase [Alphaproteobacteria bacterium]